MPSLSVLIPTHRRPATLGRCLDHLQAQTVRDSLEVIVVSDGPDPLTAKLFGQPRWGLPIRYLEVAKSQQGVCRNRGAQLASAPLVLLIGDDIFLMRDACEQHLRAHERLQISDSSSQTRNVQRATSNDVAILGHVTWDPAVGITPVMRWLERTGWQFGYGKIAQFSHDFLPTDLQHRFTYTSHLSLPTDILRQHAFREDVTAYGWEDIEWGKRLAQGGVRLFYEPTARALHHHRLTLEDSLKRMEIIGESAVVYQRILPDRLPQRWKHWGYRFLSLLPTLRGKHCGAFLRGRRRREEE